MTTIPTNRLTNNRSGEVPSNVVCLSAHQSNAILQGKATYGLILASSLPRAGVGQ
jgi:hypothetical protein